MPLMKSKLRNQKIGAEYLLPVITFLVKMKSSQNDLSTSLFLFGK